MSKVQLLSMDTQELGEALWRRREDIDVTFDDLSLTNEMICTFARGEETQCIR